MEKRQKGLQAEKLAKDYLIQQGLTPVEDNFFAKTGEIDLVMREQSVWVFVEVRYRSGKHNKRFGTAATSINPRKQSRILRTAKLYLQKNRLNRASARIDVVDISGNMSQPAIRWIRNALGDCG